jgi:hypothetical protein
MRSFLTPGPVLDATIYFAKQCKKYEVISCRVTLLSNISGHPRTPFKTTANLAPSVGFQ